MGDVLVTARTDLGDDWLLCNGEAISQSEYPELYEIVKDFSLEGSIQSLWSGTNTPMNAFKIKYLNGYWIACGEYYTSTAPRYRGKIAYATSLTGSWTVKDLWTDSSAASVYDITYGNGYYVAVGNQSNVPAIYYATSLSGTWTKVTNPWSKGYMNRITFANGYFAALGYNSSSTQYNLVYATSPTSTWATTKISTTGWNYSIIYANNYWVIGGYSDTIAIIYYANDLTATTWSSKTIWIGTGTGYNYINDIAYNNGYWIVGGQYDQSSTYYGRIAYTTSLTGTWIIKDLWSSVNTRTKITSIGYDDKVFMAGGGIYDQAQIAYSTDLSTWTIKSDLWTGTGSNGDPLTCLVSDNNGSFIASGQYDNGTHIYGRLYSIGKLLPEITETNAYAYIKAKES